MSIFDTRMRCWGCGRFKAAFSPPTAASGKNGDVLIVTDSPSREDDNAGRMGIPAVVSSMLSHAQLTADVTSAVKCFAPVTPNKTNYSACMGLLSKDIAQYDRVLLCGSNVATFVGKVDRYSASLGIPFMRDNKLFVVTHGLSDIAATKDTKSLSSFYSDLLYVAHAPIQRRRVKVLTITGTTQEEIDGILSSLESVDTPVVFDVETENLEDPYLCRNKLLSLGFCWDDDTAVSFSTEHLSAQARLRLKDWFQSSVPKIAHNFAFDAKIVSAMFGLKNGVTNLFFDTQKAAHRCNENRRSGLKYLGTRLFHYEDWSVEFGASLDPKALLRYNAIDTFVTRKLWQSLKQDTPSSFYDFTIPAQELFCAIERTGMYVDKQRLKTTTQELSNALQAATSRVQNEPAVLEEFGNGFNPNSGMQIRRLFSSENARADTLRAIADDADEELAPVATGLLDIAKYRKLLSTYAGNLERGIDDANILRPSFNLSGTVTGRLSASNPNVQNIPPEFHKVFVSRFPKGKILSADFSQIELCVVGAAAREPVLLNAAKNGEDMHTATACALFAVETPSPEQRRIAKTINFLTLYGGGAHTLAEKVGIPLSEAEDFMEKFFLSMPKLKRWISATRKKAIRDGVVVSLSGRIRHFPIAFLAKEHRNIKSSIERQAVNSPIQGDAAEVAVHAAIFIQKKITEKELRCCIINTVHDEIVIDCPENEVEEVKGIVQTILSSMNTLLPWLGVPTRGEINIGNSWKEKE